LAGILRLRNEAKIEPDARVVAILTGHVLKDTDYIIKHRPAAAEKSMQEVEVRG
jgi:threonine synthase